MFFFFLGGGRVLSPTSRWWFQIFFFENVHPYLRGVDFPVNFGQFSVPFFLGDSSNGPIRNNGI